MASPIALHVRLGLDGQAEAKLQIAHDGRLCHLKQALLARVPHVSLAEMSIVCDGEFIVNGSQVLMENDVFRRAVAKARGEPVEIQAVWSVRPVLLKHVPTREWEVCLKLDIACVGAAELTDMFGVAILGDRWYPGTWASTYYRPDGAGFAHDLVLVRLQWQMREIYVRDHDPRGCVHVFLYDASSVASQQEALEQLQRVRGGVRVLLGHKADSGAPFPAESETQIQQAKCAMRILALVCDLGNRQDVLANVLGPLALEVAERDVAERFPLGLECGGMSLRVDAQESQPSGSPPPLPESEVVRKLSVNACDDEEDGGGEEKEERMEAGPDGHEGNGEAATHDGGEKRRRLS